ncbi:MAG: hypothetical protein ACLU84_06840 [Clostridia bacterium]
MEKIKQEYNYNLKKYYAGCKYIEKNPKEFDRYINVVLGFLDKINQLLEQIPEAKEKEILEGFEI